MKLNKAIFVTSAFVFATTVQASMVFAPTNQDVNVFTMGNPAGLQLGMFDDSDTTFSGPFLNVDILNMGDTLTFSPTIGLSQNYTVTNHAGSTLTLSGNDSFSLALRQSGGAWSGPDGFQPWGYTNGGTLTWNGVFNSLVVDISKVVPPASVPVPAALWLFGSGLLGLIGVSRRDGASV